MYHHDIPVAIHHSVFIWFRGDDLIVYDGDTALAPKIERFTRTNTYSIQSTGQHLFVHFSSGRDPLNQLSYGTGFKIRYDKGNW